MLDDTFSRPVVFFAEEANGALRHVEMTTVDQGFKALHRGLEGFCLQTPEWHLAFSKLARAKLEPTPERIEFGAPGARAARQPDAGNGRARPLAPAGLAHDGPLAGGRS